MTPTHTLDTIKAVPAPTPCQCKINGFVLCQLHESAPDLLAACELTARLSLVHAAMPLRRAVLAAQAVIAKAKGGTK